MDAHERRSGSAPAARTGMNVADPGPETGRPTVYRIRVKGHLDDRWTDAYDGLTLTAEATGDTLLTAPVEDQAALHGLLRKLRDLGAPLVSINPSEPDVPGTACSEEETR